MDFKNTDHYIGPYKIVKELGRGGMGVVYLGYDKNLQRYIAIKVILGQTNNIAFKRFVREAQSIANLDHPHIVKLYELRLGEDKPCMVMEYIEGSALMQYIKKNNLTMKDSLRLLINIINAVDFAHNNGVIHRDIKSCNIIVDVKGKALLMDFGLAKLVELENKSLTKTGSFMGSPKYMSPEQAKGRKSLRFSSDVYSLGAVIYEVITGAPPVNGEDVMEILYNLLNIPVIPPRKINSEISPSLEKICLKALEFNPRNRYQSAKLLSIDLQNFLDGKKVKVKTKIPIKKLAILSSIAIVILSLSTLFLLASRVSEEIEKDIFTVAMGWANSGFWEKAEQELEKIEALSENEDDKVNLQNKKRYYQTLIKGYSENGEFYKYYDLLTERQRILPEIKAAQLFFEARQSYRAQRYDDSFKKFKEVENIDRDKKILSSYVKAELFYHIGMCCKKDMDKIFYLEKSLELSTDNESAYYHLAVIYFKYPEDDIKFNKAEEYILKCIELENHRSDYYVLLGNIALKKKNLENARESFDKARSLEEANIEALKGMTEIALYDVALFEGFFFSFLGNLEGWQYKQKDIVSLYVEDIVESNKRYYNIKKIAIKQQKKEISLTTFENWNSSDPVRAEISKEAILAERHHKDFFEIGRKLNISDEDFYKKIVERRKIENEKANYYVMAKLFLYPKSNIIDEIEEEEIENILHNEQENPLHRYLAANILIQLFQFEKVGAIAKSENIQPLERFLCAAALQDSYIFLSYNNLEVPRNDNSFTKVLLAKNHKLVLLSNEDIQEMLAEKNLRVVLATIVYLMPKSVNNKILLEKFRSDSVLNEIASNHYGKMLPASEKELWEVQKNQFADLGEALQITLLERAMVENNIFSGDFVRKILKHKNISPYTKIRAIDFLAQRMDIKMDDIKDLENNIVHAYGFYKAFLVYFMTRFVPPREIYLIDIKDKKFLRCYGYGVYSKCGKEVLNLIKEEDDANIKSIILRTATIKPFATILPQLRSRAKNSDRREIIKKYLGAEDPSLRKEAYKAYTSFIDLKDMSPKSFLFLTKKMVNIPDQVAREGSMEAIITILEELPLELIGIYDNSISLLIEREELDKIILLKSFLQDAEWEATYNEVSKEILQIEKQAGAYLIQALIARKNGEYEKAIQEMYNALEQEPGNIFYLLELFSIFIESKEQIPNKILKEILTLSRSKKIRPEILLPLIEAPKNNIWIEKILKQNCLAMNSEKNKLSYILNFRDAAWRGTWEKSWKNLEVYLEPEEVTPGSEEVTPDKINLATEVLDNDR